MAGRVSRPQQLEVREPTSPISTSPPSTILHKAPRAVDRWPPCIRSLASIANRFVSSETVSISSNASSAVSKRSSNDRPKGRALLPCTGIRWPVRDCSARIAKVADKTSSRPPPTMAPGVPPSTQKSATTLSKLSKTGPVAIRSFIKSGPDARAAIHPTEDRKVNTPYLYPFPPRPDKVLCSREMIFGITFSVFLNKSYVSSPSSYRHTKVTAMAALRLW
mmetsp:Transcript_27549/g.63874  ORF Transcript_27549/g.63874 Transcript_27549/m.63874 type:complete len:220 (+) Transcript_27549:354-1013(+)